MISDVVSRAKALGDKHRLRAWCMLWDGELCLCHLIELLGLAPSTVSKHLSVLRQAGLVEARKEGRWQFFRVAAGQAAIRRWVDRVVKADPSAQADRARARIIRGMPKERLCRHYRS